MRGRAGERRFYGKNEKNEVFLNTKCFLTRTSTVLLCRAFTRVGCWFKHKNATRQEFSSILFHE